MEWFERERIILTIDNAIETNNLDDLKEIKEIVEKAFKKVNQPTKETISSENESSNKNLFQKGIECRDELKEITNYEDKKQILLQKLDVFFENNTTPEERKRVKVKTLIFRISMHIHKYSDQLRVYDVIGLDTAKMNYNGTVTISLLETILQRYNLSLSQKLTIEQKKELDILSRQELIKDLSMYSEETGDKDNLKNYPQTINEYSSLTQLNIPQIYLSKLKDLNIYTVKDLTDFGINNLISIVPSEALLKRIVSIIHKLGFKFTDEITDEFYKQHTFKKTIH